MERKYLIKRPGNNRLVIFFSGWSTDWRILRDINLPERYDFLCLWNYGDDVWKPLERRYEEAVIIAWSFGVPVANKLFGAISKEINVTGLFAVNGTIYPVDDEKGIPSQIFINTLNALNERNLYKFRIRISGGINRFKSIRNSFPEKDILPTLKKELSYFKDKSFVGKDNPVWDYAILSVNDKIFPLDNLKQAWSGTPFMELEDQEHLPDFQTIFDLLIKDKQNVVKRFGKALFSYEENAEVQKGLADAILDSLKKTGKIYSNILEIGGGSGILTRKLKKDYPNSSMISLDIVKGNPYPGVEIWEGDAESVLKNMPPNNFDLVISGSTVQWFHSPYRFIVEVYRVLKEKGVFAFTTYLPGTYREISDLTGSGLLYLTSGNWESMVRKAGFEIETISQNTITLYFDKVGDVFSHLRATGVNGITGKNRKIGEIKEIMRNYPRENGKLPLTYETFLMVARK